MQFDRSDPKGRNVAGAAKARDGARADPGADADRELVRRFKSGDKKAFDLLFTRYQYKIFSLRLLI